MITSHSIEDIDYLGSSLSYLDHSHHLLQLYLHWVGNNMFLKDRLIFKKTVNL